MRIVRHGQRRLCRRRSALLMAGDPAAGAVVAPRRRPLARELGRRRGPRVLGAPDRRAEGVAARRRRRGRRPGYAAGRSSSAPRRLTRRSAATPRRSRCSRSAAGPRRATSPRRCAAATTSRATSPTRLACIAANDVTATASAVGSVVTSFETRDEFLEDVRGRRHGARARSARAAARHRRAAAGLADAAGSSS